MTGGETLFLVAVDPSADTLGAGLAEALNEAAPGRFRYVGVGGPKLAAYGVESLFDPSDLSVVGIFDGLRIYPTVLKRVRETTEAALQAAPAGVVLIDSWGFTIRVAERLRAQAPDLPIIKYVGPQVWASRPGRAKKLAAACDHVLTLQPFEPPYYERAGCPATFVGHPVLDNPPRGDPAGFRARYGLGEDKQIALVLFGSRASEARRLTDVFAETIALLDAQYGARLAIFAPLAASVATQIRAAAADDPRLQKAIFIDEGERADAFAAADAALACSGTVVTELALADTPAVVAYRLGALTYLVAQRIVTAPHITLVNMAAGARVLPEFVQGEATGAALAEAVARFLDDGAYAKETRRAMAAAVEAMRGEGASASRRAAEAVLRLL